MAKNNEKFSYDKLIAEVEEILDQLQNDDTMSLDAMMENVEKAVDKLKQCKKQLTDAEKRMDKLFDDGE